MNEELKFSKLSAPVPVCYPVGYEKYNAVEEYEKFKNKFTEKLKCKQDVFGKIEAVKVNNQEDFDLLISYCEVAYSVCSDFELAKVKGKYEGADWYFIEDVSDVHEMRTEGIKCSLETLTAKKKKFAEFCKEFEESDNTYIYIAIIDELPDKYSYSILKVPLHVGEKSLMLDIPKDRNGAISEITSDFINQEIYWQDKTVVYYTDELIKAIGYLRRKRKGLIEKHKTLLKSLETETKITIESEEYKI